MDYGIGMFLAGLFSGAGIGWYSALLKARIAYGDPEDLIREAMHYKGLLYKAGLPVDGDPGRQSDHGPASARLHHLGY